MSTKIKSAVSDYYTDKLKKFGNTPQGVDWNSEESQVLRFKQLAKILPENPETPFRILDYGCGYGALLDFLLPLYRGMHFTGYDISAEMIESCKSKYKSEEALWVTKDTPLDKHDYVMASGIFNVKMNFSDAEWREYILGMLQTINTIAVKGFSFNILTSYSDKAYMKDNLFYADPCWIFDYCKTNFSKEVALLHDYTLYEFTILVRK